MNPNKLFLFALGFALGMPVALEAQQEISLDSLGSDPGTPVATSPADPTGEVNLDNLGSTPTAPVAAPARNRLAGGGGDAGPKLNLNLYADFDFRVLAPEAGTPTVGFLQNHAAVLVKTLYGGDQASMYVDVLHWQELFELGINSSLLGTAFSSLPVLGTSSWRFGRILVPFGDYEFHHLYGGYVDESNLMFNKLWTDLGASWKVTVAEGLDAELFVGNGFGSDGTGNADFTTMQGTDNNRAKAVDLRLRWTPTPGSFVLASGYYDDWGPEGATGQNLYLAGLDAGDKLGPVGLKAGGFFGQVFGAVPNPNAITDHTWYNRYAWYTEAKYTFDPAWALRLRGGQVNTDTRVRDVTKQWNVNLGLLWNSGPLALEVLYFYNRQIYNVVDTVNGVNNNYHQLLVKLLLTI